jgi:hypothetical protein
MIDVVRSFDGLYKAGADAGFYVGLLWIAQLIALLFFLAGFSYLVILFVEMLRKKLDEDDKSNFLPAVFISAGALFVIILTALYPIETSGSLSSVDQVKVDSVSMKDNVATLNYKHNKEKHYINILLSNAEEIDENYKLEYKLDGKELLDDVYINYHLDVNESSGDNLKILLKKVKDKKLVPYLELTEHKTRNIKINIGLLNFLFNSKKDETTKYELSGINVRFKESNVPNFSEDFK